MYTREFKGNSLVEFPDSYTVIDIETTGLDPNYDSIIEMAAIRVQNGDIIDKFMSLVKPESYYELSNDTTENYVIRDGKKIQYVDSFIEELTGITNEMLADAPETKKVLSDFMDFLGEDIIVGHNVNFDINFIYDNSEYHLEKIVGNNFIDTMRLSRRLLKNLSRHRLADLSEYFNVEDYGMHRALADCATTLQCFVGLKATVLEQYESIEEFRADVKKSQSHNLKAGDVTSSIDCYDESHPLYGKICIFTGVLEKMIRKDAMQIVVNLGGD